jgi:hypothetical protein
LSIAGSSNNVAIATGSGRVFYFDPADTTPQGSVNLTSANVQLSSDGSLLGASSQDGSLLNIYSLPSGTVSNAFTYSGQSAPGLLSYYDLSASGTTVGQFESIASVGYSLEITPVSGSPTILSQTPLPTPSVLLSPDGTLAAQSSVSAATQPITLQITPHVLVLVYQNGQPLGAIQGVAVGWIDNGRLLVNQYTNTGGPYAISLVYSGCTIVSPTGTVLASPPLPELHRIQPVTSDTVYEPGQNVIYSLTTGQAVWTSPYPQSSAKAGTIWAGFADEERLGAVSGPYVVYPSEGQVIAVKY